MAALAEPVIAVRPEAPAGPAVKVSGVTYAFGTEPSGKPVLSDINLTLKRGEFVILTGPSGAGKTTLMTLIGAVRSLQGGSIDVLGTELAELPPPQQRDVRRKIGFIFQDHNLFEALTAFQTLWLTTGLVEVRLPRGEVLPRARALLASLGIADHLHALPRELSTGQKQRVAIARALINRPPLILADEPTASLDQAASRLVIDLIRERLTTSGATALMVTHDTRIFDLADRVVRMVDGRIAVP
jgi:putative ABC transport system ATP-binding protein